MSRWTRSRRVGLAGLVLVGAGVIADALHIAGGFLLLLPGLMLCVSGVALAASSLPRSEGNGSALNRVPTSSRAATMTASLLGGLILLPFVVVGALLVLGGNPLAIFLIGLGLFLLTGVLVVTFLVVFFANRWMGGRRAKSMSGGGGTPQRPR